jgi:hypothetical protein
MIPLLTKPQEARVAISSPTPPARFGEDVKKVRARYPCVDFSDPRNDQVERKPRSEKYNGSKILFPNIEADDTTLSTSPWASELTALPIDKSAIVLVGKVEATSAFLSSDKSGVYSEFSIRVEKVYKNRLKKPVESGDLLAVEREGGIVRFPTGKQQWVMIEGQGMPVAGEEYLLFLSEQFERGKNPDGDLHLLTGYEISTGRVSPLDSPGGGTHPLATVYRGRDVAVLLRDLAKALESSDTGLKREVK